MNRIRLLLAVFSVAGTALPVRAAETAFTVTPLPLGPDTKRETMADGIRTFVSRVDGRPGFDATNLPPLPGARWDASPPGVKPDRWISLVPAGFGARTDWLAFAFDDKGRPRLAVRRPARQWDTAGVYPDSIPPGDRQIDRNAGIELAADFAHAWAETPEGVEVKLAVAAGDAGGDQALPLMPAELEGVRALATAAALRTGKAAEGWSLVVSKTASGYQLVLKLGNAAWTARAPQDALFPYLERLMRAPGWGRAVSDFIVTEPGGARLMGWRGDRVFLDLGGSMAAFSAISGQVDWTATVEPRYNPRFAWGPASSTNAGPCTYRPSIVPVGEGGTIGRGPGGPDALPWGFDFLDDGGVLMAQDATLSATDPKKFTPRWSWTGGGRLRCGPVAHEGRAYAGGEAGEMAAFDLKDGRPVWHTPVPERLGGPLRIVGDLLVAPTPEGRLVAFEKGNGKVRWRAELGDGPAGALAETPAGLVAGASSGRVSLVDPATGAVRASVEMGSPTAGCAVSGGTVCWAGRNGRVVFLKAADLREVARVDLGATLADGILVGDAVPHRWGTGDDLQMRGPAVLAADKEGFVYVLPVP